MINSIIEKVQRTIEKYNMTNKSEHLLVGLSGGADSVTLLLCLNEIGYNIEACHVNHQLRGEESDRDEAFCVSLCEQLGVKITVKRIDVTGYCNTHSVSVEEGARILRYNAFSEISSDKICTAHNLNDCFETTVFNLARGSGLKGICSIPVCRDNIIRPLIECTRQEIEEYLSLKNQCFVIDSTNLEDEFSRNKIRHIVVPQLEIINSSLLKTYAKTLNYLRADNSFLEKTADECFAKSQTKNGFDCKYIRNLDYSIRRRVIMRIIDKFNISLSTEKIEELELLVNTEGKINVKYNTFAISDNDFLNIVVIDKTNNEVLSPVIIDKMGEVKWGNRIIHFNILENNVKYENVHKMFANCCMDYDKIIGKVVLQRRNEGDTIQLCNRSFTSDVRKLLKKAFTLEKRESAVLLSDDVGVFFVESYGVADRVKIDDNTNHILTLKIS